MPKIQVVQNVAFIMTMGFSCECILCHSEVILSHVQLVDHCPKLCHPNDILISRGKAVKRRRKNVKAINRPCHGSGSQSSVSHSGDTGSIPGRSLKDLW